MGGDFDTEFRNCPLAAQGLSQPEASQTFFACLEVFQQEDSEQAQLEKLERTL